MKTMPLTADMLPESRVCACMAVTPRKGSFDLI